MMQSDDRCTRGRGDEESDRNRRGISGEKMRQKEHIACRIACRCDVRNCGTSLMHCLKYRLVGISDCASPTYI